MCKLNDDQEPMYHRLVEYFEQQMDPPVVAAHLRRAAYYLAKFTMEEEGFHAFSSSTAEDFYHLQLLAEVLDPSFEDIGGM